MLSFSEIFDKKLQGGEIIHGERARHVHDRPFLHHNNKSKGQAMMVSALAPVLVRTEGKPNLDKMAESV